MEQIHHILWLSNSCKDKTINILKAVPSYQLETKTLLRMFGPWGTAENEDISDMLVNPMCTETKLLHELRRYHQTSLAALYDDYVEAMALQTQINKVNIAICHLSEHLSRCEYRLFMFLSRVR